MDINDILLQNSQAVEARLSELLSAKGLPQQALIDAMSYSLTAGGKRLRPTLVLEFCKACGGDPQGALDLACAVELVHTYSLIHDDLPCMDDDDFRRGKPTNHKVFGEATAVLAGDALQAYAFEVLASAELEPASALTAVKELAKASGAMGMVGGQILDMEGEGKACDLSELKLMHSLKTGALISASAKLGCIAASASSPQFIAAERYARSLGLVFQIRDDMLDVIGSASELGKSTGMDSIRGKSTFVSLLGLPKCGEIIMDETEKAKDALRPNIFENTGPLLSLADMLAERMK